MQIVNDKTLRDLEFDRVKEEIKKYCSSVLGFAALAELEPMIDLERIQRELQLVREMINALGAANIFIGPMEDLGPVLDRAREVTSLSGEDFLFILKTITSGRELSEMLRNLEGEYEGLKRLAGRIQFYRELEGAIHRTFDEDGEMREDASPLLRQLNSKKRILEERVESKLKSFLNGSQYSKMIQEHVITRRSSRLVIPIKSSYKHEIDCVVHDSSDSGQTLYIEPRTVVETNNEIRELQGEIRDERLRILRDLTVKVQQESRSLRESLHVLQRLDGIYARARYATEMNCSAPQLSQSGRIRLRNARHPLIDPKVVVPIDLDLGSPHQGILVTGPNTGGKTVTLKTVGLLCLMAQSGMPIPADAESELCLFESIRSDIGDEQSISQNLSTFSSHMKNIVSILGEVDEKSLVLIDEIGAGTDPQEGAALGISIIRSLMASRAMLIITTHFSALKHFAYQTEELKACSVEFDVETLKPTYRLIEGVGSSNAFVIAQRLGLSTDVVSDAQGFLSEGAVKTEEIIRLLELEKVELSKDRRRTIREANDAEILRKRFERQLGELETDQEKHLRAELVELERMLKSTRKELEQAIHQTRTASEDQLKSSLHNIDRTEREFKVVQEKVAPSHGPRIDFENLLVDLPVFVVPLNQIGIVREIKNENSIEVDLQGLRVRTKLADLRSTNAPIPIEENHTKRSEAVSHEFSTASPGLELHVRGMTVSDALHEVDVYLDRLVLSGLDRAFIIHGKGTGTLRRVIRSKLKDDIRVKDFSSALAAEGGDGITVVEL
jgi:DNA mismatch repair protein MutS2